MSRPKIEVASYKGRRRPLWLQILLGLILAGAPAFAVLLGVVLSGAHASVSGDPQVMIVLGCQVKPWGPSVRSRTGWTRPWPIYRTTRT